MTSALAASRSGSPLDSPTTVIMRPQRRDYDLAHQTSR